MRRVLYRLPVRLGPEGPLLFVYRAELHGQQIVSGAKRAFDDPTPYLDVLSPVVLVYEKAARRTQLEAIFAALIEGGNRGDMFIAYLLSAGLRIFAAIVEIFLGVKAEGQSPESVATPLTAVESRAEPATT